VDIDIEEYTFQVSLTVCKDRHVAAPGTEVEKLSTFRTPDVVRSLSPSVRHRRQFPGILDSDMHIFLV
jgi:hypothetical protein